MALDLESAAHQRDQGRRDRKSETGPPEAPSHGTVSLAEPLEDTGVLLRCDPDAGIRHRKAKAHLPCPPFVYADDEPDVAVLGELDSISDQIGCLLYTSPSPRD